MKDSTLAEHYEKASKALDAVAKALRESDRHGRNLAERMRDAQVGHLRSPSFEAGASASPPPDDMPDELRGTIGYSDPTGTAGVQVALRGDRARGDLDNLFAAGPKMSSQAERLAENVARYSARVANAIEKQEDTAQPGCASCARVASPGTVGLSKRDQTAWWNEVARSVTLASGVKVDLCEWCRAQARGTGEMPSVQDVESYRDTGRARKRTA